MPTAKSAAISQALRSHCAEYLNNDGSGKSRGPRLFVGEAGMRVYSTLYASCRGWEHLLGRLRRAWTQGPWESKTVKSVTSSSERRGSICRAPPPARTSCLRSLLPLTQALSSVPACGRLNEDVYMGDRGQVYRKKPLSWLGPAEKGHTAKEKSTLTASRGRLLSLFHRLQALPRQCLHA
jgi:hypothetical protein